MSNSMIPGPKRPRIRKKLVHESRVKNKSLPSRNKPAIRLPPNFNPGFGMTLSNAITSFPLDDGGGSDDEDMHKRKLLQGSKQSAEAKRSQHCEVEKRRREKMNRYMTELSQMIPACSAVPRKLDKLSILRMAVEYMKRLRGDPHSKSDYKPGFLTDEELKQLVVEAANGFMIIISCETARVLFVSDTITQVLSEPVNDWVGCSFYDLLHSKDVQKVKEQLACFDVEEALAAGAKQNCGKSPLIMHPHSMNGLRRSFLCRVKRSSGNAEELHVPDSTTATSQQKDNAQDYSTPENMIKLIHSSKISSTSKIFAVLHCTGFIRNLTPAERQTLQVEQQEVGSCLVAIARLQNFGEGPTKSMMSSNDKEFVTRIGTDGRFTYVDQRVTNVLGYLPQDLIGQISYEYFHRDDMSKMVHLHHEAMKQRSPMPTVHYRFLSNNQKWVWLAMKAFSFINPFSQQVEYVVCTNVAHTKSGDSTDECSSTTTHDKEVNMEPTLPSDVVSIFPDLTSKIQQWNESRANGVKPADGQSSKHQQQHIPANTTAAVGSKSSTVSSSCSSATTDAVIISQPCDVTVEQNAQLAQRILDEYMKNNAPSPNRKESGYQFPPGLFPTEVDLEGSAQAYHYHIEGLDNQELQQILNQVDADPFKPSTVFGDLDFDFFD